MLQNKELLYGLLFRASAETLLQVARDPKHLGAQIGSCVSKPEQYHLLWRQGEFNRHQTPLTALHGLLSYSAA